FAKATEPPVTAVRFSPDGQQLVCVSQAGLRIVDWDNLGITKSIQLSFANPHCIAFSPSGNRLAVGGGNPSEYGCITIYEWPDLAQLAEFDDFEDSVTSITWDGDSNLFASSLDRTVKHLGTLPEEDSSKSSDSYSLVELARFEGHSRAVIGTCLLRDKNALVTAGYDQSVRVWSVESGKLLRSLSQHTKPIQSIALKRNVDGLPYLATAAEDRTIRFWQPTIGRMVRYARLDSPPLSIAWCGDELLAACTDGQLHRVDPINVTVKEKIPAIDGWAYCLDVHPTQPHVAVAGSNGQIKKISLDSP
ncbi:MAG: hypothetical protein AAGG44_07965, partial [Planctomycetota bacterium]